jgi:hypothetical protein
MNNKHPIFIFGSDRLHLVCKIRRFCWHVTCASRLLITRSQNQTNSQFRFHCPRFLPSPQHTYSMVAEDGKGETATATPRSDATLPRSKPRSRAEGWCDNPSSQHLSLSPLMSSNLLATCHPLAFAADPPFSEPRPVQVRARWISCWLCSAGGG